MLPIILYESSFRWAVAWRRALRNASVDCDITETRSLTACEAAIAANPESVVGIELSTANLVQLLPQLVRWSQQFPQSVRLLLADRTLQSAELELRDAGASGVLVSRREVPRWLQRVSQLHPTPEVAGNEGLSPRELVHWPW